MKVVAGPKANRDERYWDCEVRRERAQTAVAVPERRAAAIADLSEVIPLAEQLIEESPHLYFYKAGLASTYLYRGELLLSLEQPEAATAELTKSLAASRILLDRHGALTRSMLIRGNTFLALGRARAAAGKKDEAAAHWKNAAKVFEIALKIDPDNFHHRRGQTEAERASHPRNDGGGEPRFTTEFAMHTNQNSANSNFTAMRFKCDTHRVSLPPGMNTMRS